MNRKRLKRRLKKIFDPKLLMVYFVVILMVGSGFGFVMNYNTGGGVEYFNEYRFRQTEQGFILLYEGEQLEFLNHPQQVMNFDIPDEAISALEATGYFTLSFEPAIGEIGETQYAMSVIFQHLYTTMDKMVGIGVTEEDMLHDLNVVNCSDSTIMSPVVVFKEGNESTIKFDGDSGCIEVVSGTPWHRVQFADHLVYRMLEVI